MSISGKRNMEKSNPFKFTYKMYRHKCDGKLYLLSYTKDDILRKYYITISKLYDDVEVIESYTIMYQSARNIIDETKYKHVDSLLLFEYEQLLDHLNKSPRRYVINIIQRIVSVRSDEEEEE
jgi:hypothetical protein